MSQEGTRGTTPGKGPWYGNWIAVAALATVAVIIGNLVAAFIMWQVIKKAVGGIFGG